MTCKWRKLDPMAVCFVQDSLPNYTTSFLGFKKRPIWSEKYIPRGLFASFTVMKCWFHCIYPTHSWAMLILLTPPVIDTLLHETHYDANIKWHFVHHSILIPKYWRCCYGIYFTMSARCSWNRSESYTVILSTTIQLIGISQTIHVLHWTCLAQIP